jgi:succinyl-diaminopimelate desuccinylase
MNPIELTKKLIQFSSITPQDSGCLVFIEQLLAKHNFTTYLKTFGSGERLTTNLYAQYGAARPNICFAGHIDVVPTGSVDSWSFPPFHGEEIDGLIYGRGAVDMKGPLAAVIAGVIDFLDQKQPNGSISFLLTSDEEGEATYGTNAMLDWLKENVIDFALDFAVVGEPSCKHRIGDQIALGRRGSANFNLVIHGRQGHVAYQDEAINPNHIMVKTLKDLIDLQLDTPNDFLTPSNLEITSIDVNNNVTNLIPQSSAAKFNIRYNESFSIDQLLQTIDQVIAKHTDNYSLNYTNSAEPFFNEENRFIKSFANVIKEELDLLPAYITSGGTSDARFIIKHCPVMEFGALYKLAHQVNESISIDDIQSLYKIYHNFLHDVL